MGGQRVAPLLFLVTLLALLVVPSAAAAPQPRIYVVNDDTDAADVNPGDGVCSIAGQGHCTLRAAIQDANRDGVPSIIRFASQLDITVFDLPAVTEDETSIEASDQWDASVPGGRPGVRISGPQPGGLLTVASNGSVVRGIMFVGMSTRGIHLAVARRMPPGVPAAGSGELADVPHSGRMRRIAVPIELLGSPQFVPCFEEAQPL